MRTFFLTIRALYELLLSLGEFALVMLVLISPYIAEALMDHFLGL